MKSNTLSWLKPNDKNKIRTFLLNKKVILMPSDTVFGLCGIMCQEVFDELNCLKGRSNKPFLVLARSLDDIRSIAHIPEFLESGLLLKTFWPGPLTIILKARKDAPEWLISHQTTIAVRIPNDNFLRELLADHPLLFSTSANKTEMPVPNLLEGIDEDIKKEVAVIVLTNELNQVQSVIPSTIIDVTGDKIVCIREGAILWKKIKSVLDKQDDLKKHKDC